VRDIIWTVIVIWVTWKIYDMFKNISKSKPQPIKSNNYNQKKEGEVRIEKNVKQKTHFNSNDGEYVDYEEIK
jgi:hypothetical protein